MTSQVRRLTPSVAIPVDGEPLAAEIERRPPTDQIRPMHRLEEILSREGCWMIVGMLCRRCSACELFLQKFTEQNGAVDVEICSLIDVRHCGHLCSIETN